MWQVYAKAIERHIGTKLDEQDARTLARLLARFL
jgi:hypothetical protein